MASSTVERLLAEIRDGIARRDAAMAGLAANAGGVPGGNAASGIASALGSAGSAVGDAGAAVASDGIASAAGMASVGAALGAVGLVASQVAGALEGVVNSSLKFVEAFAPSTVEVFNATIRDLNATVGQALEPVIQTATEVMRDFGATLMPIMQELRPVVARLGEAFSSAASAVLEQFGRVAEAVMPLVEAWAALQGAAWGLVEPLMDIAGVVVTALTPVFETLGAVVKVVASVMEVMSTPLKMLGDLCKAVSVVLEAFFQAIGDALGSGLQDGLAALKDAGQQMRDTFREIVKAGVLLTASFAKMAGFDGFLAKLQSGLEGRKQSAVGMAAAQNASITDYAAFGKTVATAAFTASGTLGKPKEDKDWLKDIAGDLKEIRAGNKDWTDVIADGISKAAARSAGKANNAAQGFAIGAIDATLFPGLKIIADIAGGRGTANKEKGA